MADQQALGLKPPSAARGGVTRSIGCTPAGRPRANSGAVPIASATISVCSAACHSATSCHHGRSTTEMVSKPLSGGSDVGSLWCGNAEALGDLGAVAVVAVQELDDAGRGAEL